MPFTFAKAGYYPGSQTRPPGPRILSSLSSVLAFQRNPIGFLTHLARRYGDIVQFPLLMTPTYFINRPEYVKQILQEKQRNYNRDTHFFRMGKVFLGDGIVTVSDEEAWLRQRRLLQPVFHKHCLSAFASSMTTEIEAMLARWGVQACHDPLDIEKEMFHLTLHIVSRALFNSDLGAQSQTFLQAFIVVKRQLSAFFHMPFPPLTFPTPRNQRFWKALRFMDAAVYAMIEQHRQQHSAEHNLLSILLKAANEETDHQINAQLIRDEILTFLFAGHETTSNALIWMWYLLSQHPEAEQRLQTELEEVLQGRVPEVEDLVKLPYARMVIDETMRLYPPIWLLMRHAVQDDEIGGYHVPGGANILLSAYMLHRHADVWENAECFEPERFSSERFAMLSPSAYIPFGNGPHLCIGRGFALQEMLLTLVRVQQRYHLKLVPGHPVETLPLLTLGTRHGMPMYLQHR